MITIISPLLTGHVYANGAATQFKHQIVGPYEISLATTPRNPSIGPIHLTVMIADASSKRFITDAEISLTGKPPQPYQNTLKNIGTERDTLYPNIYDATTSVEYSGVWTFVINVNGELGEASAEFYVEIYKPDVASGIATLGTLLVLVSILGISIRAHFNKKRKLT